MASTVSDREHAPDQAAPAQPGPAQPTNVPPAEDGWVADAFTRACPSQSILAAVAGKWPALTLVALTESPHRFNALRRRVGGISEKMLSQTLHTLERDGLVTREVQTTIPPRVEYSLTTLGARIAAKLSDLIEVVEAEMPAVLAARARHDQPG